MKTQSSNLPVFCAISAFLGMSAIAAPTSSAMARGLRNSVKENCTIHKGQVLSFNNSPFERDDDDTSSYSLFLNGGLAVDQDNGKILLAGNFSIVREEYPACQVVEHGEDHVILPGFIDAHSHYTQEGILGSYGNALPEWLANYVFPSEKRFADDEWAKNGAEFFLDEMLRQGTTTMATFASIHKGSAEALFEAASKRNMRVITGQIGMDFTYSQGGWAPEDYSAPWQTWANETRQLIDKWHENGRNLYAVTQRFVPTSTSASLHEAARILDSCETCYFQSHLSENLVETEFVANMAEFNESNSYVDVYKDHRLLRNRSLMGHAIHISDDDYKHALHDSQAVGVHCPTSNGFLGSGLFNVDQWVKNNLTFAIGSDVGAGTSNSMLVTIGEAYKVSMLHNSWLDKLPNNTWNFTNEVDADITVPEVGVPPTRSRISAKKAFYWITLGNAQALQLQDKIGSFQKGNEADFVVLNPGATPFSKFRLDVAKVNAKERGLTDDEAFWEKMFVLQINGNEQHIDKTYIMGKQLH